MFHQHLKSEFRALIRFTQRHGTPELPPREVHVGLVGAQEEGANEPAGWQALLGFKGSGVLGFRGSRFRGLRV